MIQTLPENVAKFIRNYVEETKEENFVASIDVPILNTVEQRQMFFGMYSLFNGEYTVQFEVFYTSGLYSVFATDEEGTTTEFDME